jgi:hypothetical protein
MTLHFRRPTLVLLALDKILESHAEVAEVLAAFGVHGSRRGRSTRSRARPPEPASRWHRRQENALLPVNST